MYAPLLEVVVVSRVGEEYRCTRVDLRHSTTQPLIIDRRIDLSFLILSSYDHQIGAVP